MPLMYITGPTASGKTTICAYLRTMGYQAYSTNEDAFIMAPERLEQLAQQANQTTVFVCGVADNDIALAGYFDKIICLTIGIATMKRRVATRKTSAFGKAPGELQAILGSYQAVLDKYANAGATMLDATPPLSDVANTIIALATSSGSHEQPPK